MLLKHGMAKEMSFKMTEYIRKGKMERKNEKDEHIMREHWKCENIMNEYAVPEWFI